MFGILKKRWKVLEYGLLFTNMKTVEKIFVVCCMLHIFLLSEMESKDLDVHVGWGNPFPEMEVGYVVAPNDRFHGKTTTKL